MEIAIIVLSSLVLIALFALILLSVVLIILNVVGRKRSIGGTDLKQIGAIENQIKNLLPQMKNDIALALSEEMRKVNNQTIQNSENQNSKLERFQANINDALNKRFDALNNEMNNRLEAINKKVDEKLAEGFKGTSESMAQVRERLQAIDAAQKNIESLSEEVISLKSVLSGNQSRGAYGEYQLSMVLNNVFGDTTGCYEEQYTLKKVKDGNDVRADAVVFMPEPNKMICIDSKFPFADYAKLFDTASEEEKEKMAKDFGNAVKKHITTIKDKYIVEGKTAPEAIMFIPNDGVFAFIHHNLSEVVDFARLKKVILTSPSTLSPILVTINMVRIEVERAKNAKIIGQQLDKLSTDFRLFGEEWGKFSNALESTSRRREELDKRVGRITNKFDTIKGSSGFMELEETGKEEEE